MITDDEIEKAWQNANFGNISKKEVILNTLKKFAQGWGTGHTAQCIVSELGLTWVRNGRTALSDKGLEYLLTEESKIDRAIKWNILIEKEPPIYDEKEEMYLIWDGKEVNVAFYDGKMVFDDPHNGFNYSVTHWMPISKTPLK